MKKSDLIIDKVKDPEHHKRLDEKFGKINEFLGNLEISNGDLVMVLDKILMFFKVHYQEKAEFMKLSSMMYDYYHDKVNKSDLT